MSGERLTWFDRFATRTDSMVSRAPFFFGCVLLVVIWVPTFMFLSVDMWQLLINTATTIVTFLLVALLQNTQRRTDAAIHKKLNAIIDALVAILTALDLVDSDAARKLRDAHGLEHREGT